MPSIDQRIRTAWEHRNLIPVVGSGVSKAVAGLPDWPALLDKGITFLTERKSSLNISKSKLNSLHSLRKSQELILGFSALQNFLGGPASEVYETFLHHHFSTTTVDNPQILNALRKLDSRVIITTNYDLLLKKHTVVSNAEISTWLDPRLMLSQLRNGRGIIHLHGRYDIPESVILTDSDYTRIGFVDHVKDTVTRALFHSGVLLFIGCSVEGVNDPHLLHLLEGFAELTCLQGDAFPHFLLVKGTPTPAQQVRLRRLGIEPISYGESFDDLPKYLESIPTKKVSHVVTADIRERLHALSYATNLSEVLSDIKEFLEKVVFPSIKVRVGFSELITENGRKLLRNQRLFPSGATHNDFSYPQTLAAWALIEGRILSWPEHQNRNCDFSRLKMLNKYDWVRNLLLETNSTTDPILSRFLNADTIKHKTLNETLSIEEIYQHWVGQQDVPHYNQFVSVPVPIIDKIVHNHTWPEYGVLNIDTKTTEMPLLSEETEPLLKLASDIVAIACKHFHQKG